jgi:hypothetical protein
VKKGFTFWISVGGEYGGFYYKFGNLSKRICLGWVAFTLLFVPNEILADAIHKAAERWAK